MPSRRTVARTPAACSPPITEMRLIGPGPQKARAIGAAAHAVIAGTERPADQQRDLRHLAWWQPPSPAWPRPWRCPRFHRCGPTMNPVMFCRNTRGMLRWRAELDEMRALQRGFGKEHAIVGDDADGHAHDMGKAADDRRAVARLELVKARCRRRSGRSPRGCHRACADRPGTTPSISSGS